MIALAAALALVQPSFPCARAATTVEQMICADPALATMDAAIGRFYAATHDAMKIGNQRTWLQQRNDCADRACLVDLYEGQLYDLFPTRAPGAARYRSRDNQGSLSILPMRGGWQVFRVLGLRPTASGSYNLASEAGAFRLDRAGRASRAPMSGHYCSWRIARLPRDRWQVAYWPSPPNVPCGGHNATIDGIYKAGR